jgi:putative salt-induced outer membrane protein YdiY
MRIWLFIALVGLGGALPARGEILYFKNGDQLTGTWHRVQETRLVFRSESAGEVTVPVSRVRTFASTRSAVLLTRQGEAFSGELSLLESGYWGLAANGGIRTVAPEDVVAIYQQESYQPAIERAPRPWTDWKGRGNFGYSLVRGDRDANNLSLGFNATRLQPNLPGIKEKYRTNFTTTMLFANTRIGGVETSANSISSNLRQDFLFTPTNFFFLLGQMDHIQTQSLDLRQTYGLGLGRDVLRSRRITLNFLGGFTYVNELFTTERRENAEGLLGEKVSLRITPQMGIDHQLNFYPSLTDRGEFRMDATSTLIARISNRLSLNTTMTNRYLSRPLPGRQNSELVLTTGLGLDF